MKPKTRYFIPKEKIYTIGKKTIIYYYISDLGIIRYKTEDGISHTSCCYNNTKELRQSTSFKEVLLQELALII